jgi:amicyanin
MPAWCGQKSIQPEATMLSMRWKIVSRSSALVLALLVFAAVTRAEERQSKTAEVVIDNFTFSPAQLTIAVGTTVTWTNRDDVPHTATGSKKPRAFDSGTLDTDDKFSHVFTKPGTYDYFCTVHPHMTGQVIVK